MMWRNIVKRKLFVSVSTLVILSGTLFGCSLNPSASDHNTTSVPVNQPVVTTGGLNISRWSKS